MCSTPPSFPATRSTHDAVGVMLLDRLVEGVLLGVPMMTDVDAVGVRVCVGVCVMEGVGALYVLQATRMSVNRQITAFV